MRHKVEAHGKQVLVNGTHWADCASPEVARSIRAALEKYFSSPALLLDRTLA